MQNDMLEWILEQAIPRNSNDESITSRILLVNFAAIHTSSNVSLPMSCVPLCRPHSYGWATQTIAHALFDLAAAPQYLQPLREEIEPIVAAEGWTKAAMGKMWKIDSFLRESQRFNGISLSKSPSLPPLPPSFLSRLT